MECIFGHGRGTMQPQWQIGDVIAKIETLKETLQKMKVVRER
jgi:hypothetical protein